MWNTAVASICVLVHYYFMIITVNMLILHRRPCVTWILLIRYPSVLRITWNSAEAWVFYGYFYMSLINDLCVIHWFNLLNNILISQMGNHWNMQWRHKNDVNQSNCIQCAIKTLSTWSFLTKIDYLRNEIIIVIFSRCRSFWIRWLRWLQVRLCWLWSQRCWLQQCWRHDADDFMMTT